MAKPKCGHTGAHPCLSKPHPSLQQGCGTMVRESQNTPSPKSFYLQDSIILHNSLLPAHKAQRDASAPQCSPNSPSLGQAAALRVSQPELDQFPLLMAHQGPTCPWLCRGSPWLTNTRSWKETLTEHSKKSATSTCPPQTAGINPCT